LVPSVATQDGRTERFLRREGTTRSFFPAQ
jgi:hypothetical protein